MICSTCETNANFICPSCLESTSSSWHKTEEAKDFSKWVKSKKVTKEKQDEN